MQNIKSDILTKWKIVTGYLLLVAVLFFSLIFIYSEMKSFSSSDVSQNSKTDSLLLLLHQKDKNTISMLQVLDDVNNSLLSMREVDRIIARQDSAVTQQRVQHRIITKRDSIITSPKKKGFFKRLAEVFSPSKDSALLVNTSLEFRTDTLMEDYNPVDSLHREIRKIRKKKSQAAKARNDDSELLHRANRRLSIRIDSFIRSYDKEFSLKIMQKVKEGQQVGARSIKTIGIIAVGAVILSVVFLFLIWRDITRSNRYRRKLEVANRRGEELLEAREKLMLTITHDFKAPLGSIIGYVDLLSEIIVNERQQLYLRNMKDSSTHLLRLVNDLLDFHRLDLKKMEINNVSFNPARLFEELNTRFNPLAQAKGLLLSCDVSDNLDQLFSSDPIRLRQITDNLLSNAIKFTTSGSVKVIAEYDESLLKITISDTGKGMDPEDRERIFQEFIRLPGAQGEEGFGLGLSIVHKLIHLLNGSISVESLKGEGSTFFVTLPLELSTDDVSSRVKVKSLSAKSLNILLIDDDKIQLALTAAMLEQQGISATCCEQLEELTEHLRTEKFDYLLTDVQMPFIDGFDLLKLLRASNILQARNIPIIAVTARSEMNEAYFQKYGFYACLHKPFSTQELMEVIDYSNVQSSISSSPLSKICNLHSASAGINFTSLLTFSGDDKEAGRSIIDSFVVETTKDMAILSTALQDRNVDVISSIAHKLLPLFTLIQAEELLSILSWLELKKESAFCPEMESKASLLIASVHSIIQQAGIFRDQI